MALNLAHGCGHYQFCINLYLKRQRSHQNDMTNSLIDVVIDSAYYHGNMEQLKDCVILGINHLQNTPEDAPTSVAVVRGFWRIVCLWSRLRRRIVKQQGALLTTGDAAEKEQNKEILNQAVEGIDASAHQAAAEVWEALHRVNQLEAFRSSPFDRIYRATQQCVLYGQETDGGECHFYRLAWQCQLFSCMLTESDTKGSVPLQAYRQPLPLQVAMLGSTKQGQWVDAAQSFFDDASEGLDSVEEILVHSLFAVFKEAKEYGRISSVGSDLLRRGAHFSSTMLKEIATAASEVQQRDALSLVYNAVCEKAAASDAETMSIGGQFEDEESDGNPSTKNSVTKFTMFMCLAALARVGDPDFIKRMNECLQNRWVHVGDEPRVFLLLQYAIHSANPAVEAAPAIAILRKAEEAVSTLTQLVDATRWGRKHHHNDADHVTNLLNRHDSAYYKNSPQELKDKLDEATETLASLHTERVFHQLIHFQLITEDPGMVATVRQAIEGRGYFQWRWLERLLSWSSKRRYRLSPDDQQYIVALVKKQQSLKSQQNDTVHHDELSGLDKIRTHYALLLHDVETQSCRNFLEHGVISPPPKLQDPAVYFLRKGKKTTELHPDRNACQIGALPREPITGDASVASICLQENENYHFNLTAGAFMPNIGRIQQGLVRESSSDTTFKITNEMRLSAHLIRVMNSMQREGDGGFLLSASACGLGGGNVTSIGKSARGAFGKKRSISRMASFHNQRLANVHEAVAQRLQVSTPMPI